MRSFLLSVALAFTGVVSLGAPAQADIFKPSKADQIKVGDDAAKSVDKQYKIVHDKRSERLQRVFEKLLAALPKKDREGWHWKVHLIESKEINAFALPGGNLYFFTGLIDKTTSDDEIAAVVGHEMGHVYRQHWANQVADQTKRQLGLAILLGATRANRGWQQVASLGDGLLSLGYSRKDEDQADEAGFNDMVAAGYNPQGMLDLFAILQKAGDGGTPEFLRTHPLTKSRIEKTRERIEKLNKSKK